MSKPGPISAKPLSVLLSDVFSDAYAKQGFAARELVTRWAEIAGSEIAAHSEPLKIQWPRPVEGQPQEPATLVLRVEGPAALEIQHKSDVILERVKTTPPGTVGSPLKVDTGSWVIGVSGRTDSPPQTFDQARPAIEKHLADQQRQELFSNWLDKQLKSAKVSVAKRYGSWPFGV